MRLICALWLVVTAVTLPAVHAQPVRQVKAAKSALACESLCAELFASIRSDPAKLVMRLEEALVINEACSAEIVTAAMDAVNAEPAWVDKIMRTALDVVPQRAAAITAAVRNYAATEVAAAIPVGNPNAGGAAATAPPPEPPVEGSVEIRRAELPDFAPPQPGPGEEVRRAELPLVSRSMPIVEVRRAEAVPSAIPYVEPTAMPLPQQPAIQLMNVPKAKPLKKTRRR